MPRPKIKREVDDMLDDESGIIPAPDSNSSEITQFVLGKLGSSRPRIQDSSLVVGSFRCTPIGLELVGEQIPTTNDLQNLGRVLKQLEGSIQWLIGDWVIAGETVEWGKISEFADEIGFDVQSVYDCSYVARKVDFSLRSEKLSFGHHRLVAPLTLEEQRYWLTQALQNQWSISQMRDAMRPKQNIPSSVKSASIADYGKQIDKLVSKPRWNSKDRQEVSSVVDHMESVIATLRHRLSGSDS